MYQIQTRNQAPTLQNEKGGQSCGDRTNNSERSRKYIHTRGCCLKIDAKMNGKTGPRKPNRMWESIIEYGNRIFSQGRNRTIATVLLGFYGFTISYIGLTTRGFLASDFQWPLKAAEYLLHGVNPYYQIPNNFVYPYESPFLYPLPTALVSIPFTLFKPYIAGALFFGVISGILAYAILKDNWQRIPVFFGASYIIAATVAQWSPLLMAAALLPVNFRWIVFLKPTSGLIAFIYRPTIRAITIYLLLVLVSVLILPTWPYDWLMASTSDSGRFLPVVLIPPGFIMLFSIFSVKTRQGRTLLAASLVPRHPYWYDGVLLWLIPETLRQNLALTGLSWLAYLGWRLISYDANAGIFMSRSWPWQISLMYIPLLVMILAQVWSRNKERIIGHWAKLSSKVP